MPQNMSFSYTKEQYVDGSKDVTRRLGWLRLRPGTLMNGVEKAMGLRKGEKMVRLGQHVVISTRLERLDAITPDDVVREGFPELATEQFIEMFCRIGHCKRDQIVNRIEFKRVK